MKKIILLFVLLFSFFVWSEVFAYDCALDASAPECNLDTNTQNNTNSPTSLWWWCTYTEWSELSSFLNWCKPENVVWAEDMRVESWLKSKVNNWIKNISLILWILAVWSLVYAWLLMQFSAWEDELIKKSKNIIKWTLIWLVLLISASGIIYIVVNVMFWLWWE